MDVFTKEKRSEIMSKIRGKWTKPEIKAHNILKGNKIKHRMHPDIIGNPDIFIRNTNILIFIDGDFWHGKKYPKLPKSNKIFWKNKIEQNMMKDIINSNLLNIIGYKVVRIWEDRLSSAFLLDAAVVR